MDSSLMFVLQAALAVFMLFLSVVLNGMRTSIERVAAELKMLNDTVLGKYITRDEADSRAKDQRQLDHELRGMITEAMISIAKNAGKPYDGPKNVP